MAFGRRDDGMGPKSTTTSGGRSNSLGNLTAFIDQGSEFDGKLSFKDTVRIDGRFSGEISSENTLIVGETGEIEADIHSPSVVISGVVTGDVFATSQLVLYKTACLTGNVTTPNLVMEEGALLNGQLKMERPGPTAKAPAKPEVGLDAGQASASATQSSNATNHPK